MVVLLVLGSGLTVQLTEMPGWRVEGYSPAVYKFPDLAGPARHVRERLREGDVVLATDPFQVRHLMGLDGRADAPAFYWPESLLLLSATLDDSRPVPLDRRDGTPMLSDLESFEDLFARHRRIWYVVQPHRHDNQNSAKVSAFLRQHMEVVYEDFEALVLFRDASHRPAYQRRENERAQEKARAHFLPEARHLPEE